jgi:iron complex transport system substrate-binding protein
VKIVSLLPSATEIVYALGLGAELRAVTFECDHPVEARSLPQVSGTALATDADLTPAEIDRAVTEMVGDGLPIYTLDRDLLRTIDPDVILTQDLCQVCAVPAGAVDDALASIGCRSEVVSLDPHRLDEVIATVGLVGEATGTGAEAAALMTELHSRLDVVRQAVAGLARPRVLVLEWADPPFNAGHWVPDMVEAAGGVPVLARAGDRSRRLFWEEIDAAEFDVVVFMPCGFDLDGAVGQAGPLLGRPELAEASGFLAVDANACFSRPGPRLVDGVEALAEALHGVPPGGPAGQAIVRRLR